MKKEYDKEKAAWLMKGLFKEYSPSIAHFPIGKKLKLVVQTPQSPHYKTLKPKQPQYSKHRKNNQVTYGIYKKLSLKKNISNSISHKNDSFTATQHPSYSTNFSTIEKSNDEHHHENHPSTVMMNGTPYKKLIEGKFSNKKLDTSLPLSKFELQHGSLKIPSHWQNNSDKPPKPGLPVYFKKHVENDSFSQIRLPLILSGRGNSTSNKSQCQREMKEETAKAINIEQKNRKCKNSMMMRILESKQSKHPIQVTDTERIDKSPTIEGEDIPKIREHFTGYKHHQSESMASTHDYHNYTFIKKLKVNHNLSNYSISEINCSNVNTSPYSDELIKANCRSTKKSRNIHQNKNTTTQIFSLKHINNISHTLQLESEDYSTTINTTPSVSKPNLHDSKSSEKRINKNSSTLLIQNRAFSTLHSRNISEIQHLQNDPSQSTVGTGLSDVNVKSVSPLKVSKNLPPLHLPLKIPISSNILKYDLNSAAKDQATEKEKKESRIIENEEEKKFGQLTLKDIGKMDRNKVIELKREKLILDSIRNDEEDEVKQEKIEVSVVDTPVTKHKRLMIKMFYLDKLQDQIQKQRAKLESEEDQKKESSENDQFEKANQNSLLSTDELFHQINTLLEFNQEDEQVASLDKTLLLRELNYRFQLEKIESGINNLISETATQMNQASKIQAQFSAKPSIFSARRTDKSFSKSSSLQCVQKKTDQRKNSFFITEAPEASQIHLNLPSNKALSNYITIDQRNRSQTVLRRQHSISSSIRNSPPQHASRKGSESGNLQKINRKMPLRKKPLSPTKKRAASPKLYGKKRARSDLLYKEAKLRNYRKKVVKSGEIKKEGCDKSDEESPSFKFNLKRMNLLSSCDNSPKNKCTKEEEEELLRLQLERSDRIMVLRIAQNKKNKERENTKIRIPKIKSEPNLFENVDITYPFKLNRNDEEENEEVKKHNEMREFFQDYRQLEIPNEKPPKTPNLAYVQACIEEKALPLPLLSYIKDETIELSNYRISIQTVQAFANVLPTLANEPIKKINLTNNGMNDEAFSIFLSGLINSSGIENLNYCRNELGEKSTECILSLLSMKSIKNLQELTLDNCRINCSNLVKLIDRIKNNSQISKFHLKSCMLDDLCSLKLSNYISTSKKLENIRLNHLEIHRKNLFSLISSFQTNSKLQYVDLSNLSIGTRFTFGESLKEFEIDKQKMLTNFCNFLKRNKTIVHLNLSNCSLNEQEIITIVKGIQESSSLMVVHLTGNEIVSNCKKNIRQILKIGDSNIFGSTNNKETQSDDNTSEKSFFKTYSPPKLPEADSKKN